MPLTAGDKLGPYEILSLLGKGGMGEVYRAHDSRLDREVAVKVSAQQFSERFEREARVIASLNHPNVCHLYDVGPNYLVMELVEGPTLGERLAKGAIPLDESLKIAAQMADALNAAHEKNITHRDLKPGNIKIRPDGVVKVLDFGLAKVDRSPASGELPENSPTLSMAATQAGFILGTAGYMSPEQARGEPVDKRADIWAYGVVLHEMLTGQRLFEGKTVSDTLAAVLMKDPDLGAVPDKARKLVQACLDRDPKKRLRDIGEAWRLLEEPGSSAAAQAAPSRSRLRLAWSLAGVLAAALVALAYLHFREKPPEQPSVRFQIAPPEKAGFQELALSPDARYLAFIDQLDSSRRLWIRPLDTVDARALPGTEAATYPFWSPDSAYIGFFANGKVKKVAVTGGPAVPLCDANTFRGGTWTADGILFSQINSIYRVAAAGGTPSPITHPKDSETHLFPSNLGKGRFLYTAVGGTSGGIMAGSLSGSAPVSVVPDASNAMYVPPSSGKGSGHILFRREATLMALPFDAEKLRATGDVFPAAPDRVGQTRNAGLGAFSASENGVLAYGPGYSGGGNRQVVWIDRSGKRLDIVSKPLAICCNGISLSRDSAHALFPVLSETSPDEWVQDIARGTLSRLTFTPNTGDGVFSPDGDRVAVGARLADGTNIYVKAASGSGKEEPLAKVGPQGNVWDWSRDGKFIVYNDQGGKTGADLWLLPLEGDHKPVPYLQTQFNESQAAFSPDGKWMAYVSDESGPQQVWVQSIPAGSGRWQISTDGGQNPVWRQDGKELFYHHGSKLIAVPVTITATNVSPGKPQVLFDGVDLRFQASADGKKFLVNVTAESGSTTGPAPVTIVLNWRK